MLKQRGGIFGRNPTFNNVEVEGDLTVDGVINGSISTNADLTGPITSVGNATSVAKQTGTGSVFVMNASPSLVTPLLGVPTSGTLTFCTMPFTGLTGTPTTWNQDTTGLAATATALATPRAINTVNFDGTSAITVTAAAETLTGTVLKSTVVTSSLTSLGTIGSLVATTADINGGTVDGAVIGATATASGRFTTIVATDKITPATGTTTITPLKFTEGVNLTTTEAGAVEYDGEAQYFTNATGRGVVETTHFSVLKSAKSLANSTANQSVFPAPQALIFLAANTTYFFEGQYIVSSGGISHTTSISFDVATFGTSPLWSWSALGAVSSSSRTQDTVAFTSSFGGSILANSGTGMFVKFQGVVTVTNASNVTPIIKFSAAPGGTNQVNTGSYIKFTAVGSDTVTSVGPWS